MVIGEKSSFSKLAHIAVVVKDIERAVQFYSSVGIGPFVTPVKVLHDNSRYVKRIYRDSPADYIGLIVREARIGPAVLQLVQHIEGEDIYKEFIDKRGEGVQHLGFVVDNIDKAEKQAVKMGLNVTQRGRRQDGSGFSYFDTEDHAGVILELRQDPLDGQ